MDGGVTSGGGGGTFGMAADLRINCGGQGGGDRSETIPGGGGLPLDFVGNASTLLHVRCEITLLV